jgi:hypothetical protein
MEGGKEIRSPTGNEHLLTLETPRRVDESADASQSSLVHYRRSTMLRKDRTGQGRRPHFQVSSHSAARYPSGRGHLVVQGINQQRGVWFRPMPAKLLRTLG